METKNKSFRVFLRVLETWLYTLIGMSGLLMIAVVLMILSRKYLGPRGMMLIVGIGTFAGLLIYVFSMRIVIWVHNMHEADRNEYPLLYDVSDEICERFLTLKRIPLFIWPDGSMNACAFGPGFGFSGIAITPTLYKKLSREELKGVIAHEIAHIRCKDVGIFCFMTILSAWLEMAGRSLIAFAAATFVFPAAILGGLMLLVKRVLFPIGQAAISKGREYTADKLASKYCGTPDHLITALGKICCDKHVHITPSAFDDLWYSHPLVSNRIANLLEGTTLASPKGN